jgi:release factor glutamine methyltransferase
VPGSRSATRSTSAVIALTAVGCDTPRLDAELLLAAATNTGRASLIADPGRGLRARGRPTASPTTRDGGREREPVAYILGSKGFRHIELGVDPRV